MSHHCASHPRVPCHNSYTYQGQAFGLPHHIEDDATSDYPDSLPDLVTDSGAPYPSPQTSSALTTRGPLDLYRPGTCDINHAPNVVDRLLGGDSLVLTLYQRSMGAAAFRPPPPSDDDLVPTVNNGVHGVRIREAITFNTRHVLETISAIIHCGANDHNPLLQGGGPHIPSSIPDACLEEIGLAMPTISLLRNDRLGITYEMRVYKSREEALATLQLIYDICQHYILWMAFAMLCSFENSPESCLNFGAAIGMHTRDFMPRVLERFPFGGFAPLAAYMANKEHANSMDFALVRLLNPACEHVLIGSHDGNSYITTWPVPNIQVPLLEAAPVPASARDVLSRGIRRRQLRSVQQLLAELTV